MTKSNRIRLWVGGITLGVMALFCGVGLWVLDAAFGIKVYGDELDVQLARAKELGIPTDATEITFPTISPEQDATAELVAIHRSVQEQRKSVTELRNSLDQDKSLTPDERLTKFSNEVMKRHERQLESASLIISEPGFQVARDWNRGPWLALPEYSSFLRIARMLGYRACWRFRTGKWNEAIQDLKTLAAWRDYSKQEPVLVGLVVGYSIDMIWLRCHENGIATAKDDSTKLRELKGILESSRFVPNIKRSFESTPLIAATCARNIRPMQQFSYLFLGNNRFSFAREPRRLVTSGIPSSVLGRNMLKSFLEFWNDQQESINSGSEPLIVLKQLEDARNEAIADKSLAADFIRATTSSMDQMRTLVLRHEATLRSIEGLLSVFQFNQEFGKMPATMTVAGRKQVDPYSNQAMKLVVEGQSVKVYCLGTNLKDDLGKWRGAPNSEGFRGPELDVGACYPAREPMPVR